ncbi:MAG: extensin family protein [Variovorax sp.]|nr:MAG: extensin family protein [Variovorax sp.]
MNISWSRAIAWGVLATLGGLGFAVYSGAIAVPERFNPWAPLDVKAPPNALTGFKLAHARDDATRCLQALSQTGMQFDLVPDRVTGPGCGFENAVRLRQANVRFGAPLTLSCPMALSFFMWERHALQPAAAQHFGQSVASIDHLGSYACRNINRGDGGTTALGVRSRHATADALDVAGLTLRGGQRITVLKDWPVPQGAEPGPAAALLRDLQRGGCSYFGGALGPDYNAVHRDHFHFETGGFSLCR